MEEENVEDLNPEDLEVVISNGSDEIIIRDTQQIGIKDDELKTTEYFLVENEDMGDENQEEEFLTVENDCEDDQEEEYIAVEIQDTNGTVENPKKVIEWNEICRICASGSEQFIPIFIGEGLEHELANKINTYLPLEISEDDTLPQQACYNCAATLISWHEMFKGCLDAQQRLIDVQNKINSKDQYSNGSSIDENLTTVLEPEIVSNGEQQVDVIKNSKQEETEECVEDGENERKAPEKLRKERGSKSKYTYMCGVCEELYSEEFDLMRHLKQEHQVQADRDTLSSIRYECNICNKSFARKANLINHLQVHKDCVESASETKLAAKSRVSTLKSNHQYQCDLCKQVLSHRRAFLRHIRVHTDERPVMCHECGKNFRIEDDLKRHIDDVHRKIKRYGCDICGNSFAGKGTRDAHRRIHTGEKPYPCPTCAKTFRSVNLLGVHKRTHTNYRPFQCSYCEKAFRAKQKLAAHEAIHTGIRPYPCDVCGKLFAAKGEASRHRTVHFPDKPFQCTVCGISYRLKRYLKTHIKLQHKESADTLLESLQID